MTGTRKEQTNELHELGEEFEIEGWKGMDMRKEILAQQKGMKTKIYYYYINNKGKIKRARWKCTLLDVERYEYGNVFPSYIQAENAKGVVLQKKEDVTRFMPRLKGYKHE